MRVATAATLAALLASVGMASAGSAAFAAGPSAAPRFARVCPGPVALGVARCSAIQLLNPNLNWHGVHVPAAGRGPGHKPGGGGGTTFTGYTPQDLRSAYGLGAASSEFGSGETVAVVDAYDDPNAAADLAVYRKAMGLPPLCGTPTAGTGCSGASFTKENQLGAEGSYPTASTSWSEEISLDLDMVSAICPNCSILLVEANSASFSNLMAAEATALSAQPAAVSNSYGGSEFSGETLDNAAYSALHSAITVSAGDGGYGVEFPAAAPGVVAVGGTTLSSTSSSGVVTYAQSVWSGTGSGCSAYEANPGWQPVTSLCHTRTVADVAADANPTTGVAVYDSYGESGWMVFGGTSVASPIVASVFALAGYSGSSSAAAEGLYSSSGSLIKVTSGSNARRCSDYLCNAADSLTGSDTSVTANQDPGYNGPTGNGTPYGLSGF